MSKSLFINSIDIAPHTGYGRAANELKKALERLDVNIHPSAPTVLNFCMPKDYIYRDYSIGYTPWESTEIPSNWYDPLSKVDELWSTSKWSANVLQQKANRSVFVLPHGVTDNWMPFRHERKHGHPFTYLHVGEPAVRKGGDLVLDAWYRAFKDTNSRLIYKTTGIPMARVKNRSGSIVFSPPMLENGQVINQVYSDLEMWRLFCEVDCMVYPTRGEGFGFIPLEAMASGLPTILPSDGGTGEFSNYGIPLNNYMWSTSNQVEHPGLWLDHDVEEIITKMKKVRHDYEAYAKRAYGEAEKLHRVFDWNCIAEKLINRLDGHL